MANSLNTIGSIATYLASSIGGLSATVSGTMVQTVDLARQHVANYLQITIGSNAVLDAYQPAIIDFAKSDIIQLSDLDGGHSISLAELTVTQSNKVEAAGYYANIGEKKLKYIPRGQFFFKARG